MRQRKTKRQPAAGRAATWVVTCALAMLPSAGDSTGPAPGEYTRIVSINLAADELLLDLVDPERIAALSRLASDPELSRLADRAAAFPSTGNTVEEVLRFEPDLVFASQFTSRNVTGLLERFGIEVVRLPAARNLRDCRELVLTVAAVVGETERGEQLAAEMDRRLAELNRKGGLGTGPATALVYGHSGYVQGRDTLIHDILESAGFRNHAAALGIAGEAVFPLERLVLNPPDFLVLLTYHERDPTLGAMHLRHRALRGIADRTHIIEIPLSWTITASHLTVDAAARLREKAEKAPGDGTEAAP